MPIKYLAVKGVGGSFPDVTWHLWPGNSVPGEPLRLTLCGQRPSAARAQWDKSPDIATCKECLATREEKQHG